MYILTIDKNLKKTDVEQHLKRYGLSGSVISSPSIEDGISLAEAMQFDIIFIGFSANDENIQCVKELDVFHKTRTLVLADLSNEKNPDEAITMGIQNYLTYKRFRNYRSSSQRANVPSLN